jgi:hypothetical protein
MTKKTDLVTTPPKPPAPPKRTNWKTFDRFVKDADELCEYFDEYRNDMRLDPDSYDSRDVEDHEGRISELRAKFREGLEQFDSPEKYDDEGDLKRSYVAIRLAAMVGAFSNAAPGAPEVFMTTMVDHVAAFEGLSASILESACRQLVATMKFSPSTSEVMKELTEQWILWNKRKLAAKRIEETRLFTLKALQNHEEKKKKSEQEAARRQAIYAVRDCMAEETRLANEIENLKIRHANELEKLTQRHAEAAARAAEASAKLTEMGLADAVKEGKMK